MEKKEYSLIDLLLDESFIQWAYKDDTREWEGWKDPSSENKKLVERARQIIRAQQFKEVNIAEQKIEEVKQAIEANIALKEKSVRRSKLINFNSWMARAAVIAFIIASISLWYYIRTNSLPDGAQQELVTNKFIEKKTANGQKLTINLSDGTTVKMNSGSKLIFPEVFENDKREVFLEGEAFLKVKKDINRPFIITSGNIKTTVLGTSFNIRAYKIDKTVAIALVSGKVSLERTNQTADDLPVILEPNEMLIYNKESRKSEKINFDPFKVLAWKNKVLYFENADLEEVLGRIERWYGITFVNLYKGTVEKEFSGSYENKSLKAVMEGVSFAYGFEFEIKDKIVIIK